MPSSACDWSSDVCSRSEEHTSELQSHSEISYPVFCLKKKKKKKKMKKGLRQHKKKKSKKNQLIRFDNTFFFYFLLYLLFFFFFFFFFFNDTATTEIYTNLNTLSLHDALPICHIQNRMPSSACD